MTTNANTTKLTADTITRDQIRKLGIEAFEHGDMAMFDTTALALSTNAAGACSDRGRSITPHELAAARQRCADAINAAHAQES